LLLSLGDRRFFDLTARSFLGRRSLRSRDGRRRDGSLLNRLVLSKRCKTGLLGDHRSSSSLSLCWRRSSGGFTSLTTCLCCGIFLFVHVIVLKMLVSVLDEKVVNCFLPCFAAHQHCSDVTKAVDSLLAHQSSNDLFVRGTTPESLEITHDIVINLLRRVDRSLDLVKTWRRDKLSAGNRSRASRNKEWMLEDLRHLEMSIDPSHRIRVDLR
jgi:hypothetical protein